VRGRQGGGWLLWDCTNRKCGWDDPEDKIGDEE
jgi:hypothetical protein